MGVMFDTLGRKFLLMGGVGLAGLCIGLIPLFDNLYPSFFLCNLFAYAGAMFGLNVPLAPDYIEKSSIGLANLFVVILSVAGNICGSSLLLAIP